MNQYDMHTHILPGIDDGAKDLQDALVADFMDATAR